MIVYNVTINIDTAAEQEWLVWMKDEHIPAVMTTGLFLECRMFRVLADDEGGTTYAVQYTAADMDHYERYRNQHAARLQAESQERFGGRFVAFRTLLQAVHPL